MSARAYRRGGVKAQALMAWKARARPESFFGGRLATHGGREHSTLRLIRSGLLVSVTVWNNGTRTSYTVEP